ncbi:late embryogenesis abundant protein 31-like [Punica granatum]|uniref:Late embryogenesis abundant protein 31-like n=1 Tax=Punica granatum TaxID=22663 RepID=A0A218VRR0_PUNGR|nr:late embryogenesis abundant protein 31-like [Punica granatum]OWM62999.1 hypothetical protein CDL15_Pgr020293 [Punica granatum]
MSQQQQLQRSRIQQDPITYGDVFNVQGKLAEKPITPTDASMMQRAETALLGWTQKGGTAALMQSAASQNARSHIVSGGGGSGGSSRVEVGDGAGDRDAITIGEALEAAALTAGQKLVERSDAAAIQAAEVRATGRTTIAPGGVAAAAQSAANLNARTASDADKARLVDVLSDAASKLASD